MSTSPIAGIFQAMAKSVSQSPTQALAANVAESMETHAQTVKEANTGDKLAIRKLAAETAAQAKAQSSSPAKAPEPSEADVAAGDGSGAKLNVVG